MPQTVFDVGDPITSRLKLGVTPDGTTVVTVVVRRPDGTAIATPAISAFGGTGGDEKTVQWYATLDGLAGSATTAGVVDGDWLAVWTVTGTGAGVQAKVYNVRALAGTALRPAWAPFLSDVADLIPRLTVDMVAPGSQIELGTFTGTTTPTDEQAQRLTDRTVNSMVAELGPIQLPAVELARAVAATRTAATILRAYARVPEDYTAANALDRRGDSEYLKLVVINNADGGTAPFLVPKWNMTDPVTWGDDYLF